MFTDLRSRPYRRCYTGVALGILCLGLALPGLAGAETVVSSVGYCSQGVGRWSDPTIWSPRQVPDNGMPKGTTYDVYIPDGNCEGVLLDVSATVNEVSIGLHGAYWDGAKDKAAKVRAHGVSLTVLRDCKIDELGMTNGRLDIGGVAWPSHRAGWFLTDTKVKARTYRQDFSAQARFVRSTIDIEDSFFMTEDAWAELEQSTLETQKLELSDGGLLLGDGATVKVKGDFEQRGGFRLGLQLDGRTNFSVAGGVVLGGELYGWLSDGYVPAVGDEFPILRYKGSITGNWTAIYLPQLPAGRAWSVVTAKQAVYLKVVPTT
jgi:hypothetical protein